VQKVYQEINKGQIGYYLILEFRRKKGNKNPIIRLRLVKSDGTDEEKGYEEIKTTYNIINKSQVDGLVISTRINKEGIIEISYSDEFELTRKEFITEKEYEELKKGKKSLAPNLLSPVMPLFYITVAIIILIFITFILFNFRNFIALFKEIKQL